MIFNGIVSDLSGSNRTVSDKNFPTCLVSDLSQPVLHEDCYCVTLAKTQGEEVMSNLVWKKEMILTEQKNLRQKKNNLIAVVFNLLESPLLLLEVEHHFLGRPVDRPKIWKDNDNLQIDKMTNCLSEILPPEDLGNGQVLPLRPLHVQAQPHQLAHGLQIPGQMIVWQISKIFLNCNFITQFDWECCKPVILFDQPR